MNIFKIFSIFSLVTTWMEKSLKDGVIDKDEILELVRGILEIAGVDIEIKV